MEIKENTVVKGDCLYVLPKIAPDSVDLIYLDPPFFTDKVHKGISRDSLEVLSFKDVWDSSFEYSQYMFERILHCKKILKNTGSIFVHCDRNSSYILRHILNVVFGEDNFQSEIIWTYKRWSNAKKGLLNQHQNILFFSKTSDFKWNEKYVEYSPTTNVDQILQKRERDGNGQTRYARDKEGNVIYGEAKKGVPLGDVWDIPFLNPRAKERTGYPTQKPLVLLERILNLATDVGDLVVDPFCGSGTTLVASKILGRNYIGIDQSDDAITISQSRLSKPVKTMSKVLENGADSFLSKDPWVDSYLNVFEHSKVHRNMGLDALLKGCTDNIFLKVQKKNETLIESYNLMYRALKRRKNSKGILIQTKTSDELFEEMDLLPKDIDIQILKM